MDTAGDSSIAGGIDAPESWLDEHGDALYAFAMLRLGHAATAEDLVQDTLLAALVSDSRFEARASVRTWLTAILKNKIVDHLRRAGREISYEPTADDADDLGARFDASGHWQQAPLDWGDPQRVAENADLAAAMAQCIDGLPPRLRTPFVLKEVDGMESGTLVDMLKISSTNNLWVMLSRGRERVRRCLEQNWYGGQR